MVDPGTLSVCSGLLTLKLGSIEGDGRNMVWDKRENLEDCKVGAIRRGYLIPFQR